MPPLETTPRQRGIPITPLGSCAQPGRRNCRSASREAFLVLPIRCLPAFINLLTLVANPRLCQGNARTQKGNEKRRNTGLWRTTMLKVSCSSHVLGAVARFLHRHPKDLDPEKPYPSPMAMLNNANGESGRDKP